MPSLEGQDDGGLGFGVKGSSGGGDGVVGESQTGSGVVGRSLSGTGQGVVGYGDPSGDGVAGKSDSGNGVIGSANVGTGVRGISNSRTGVVGESTHGTGVQGIGQMQGTGVEGTCPMGIGVKGESSSGIGVYGKSETSTGVEAFSNSGVGLHATTNGSGAFAIWAIASERSYAIDAIGGVGIRARGVTDVAIDATSLRSTAIVGTTEAGPYGVVGTSDAPPTFASTGVLGYGANAPGVVGTTSRYPFTNQYEYTRWKSGVVGFSRGSTTCGVIGESDGGFAAVMAQASNGATGLYASGSPFSIHASENVMVGGKLIVNTGAFISGDVMIYGDFVVTGGVKGFGIDHPIAPSEKLLIHACVESNELKNLYDGVATCDAKGVAVVKLPDWFQALNHDFRYQLTSLGGPAPELHVSTELSNNEFKISGGKANGKVSWQVTGNRHDASARRKPLAVEVPKAEGERGRFVDPLAHGRPADEALLRHRAPPAPHPPEPLQREMNRGGAQEKGSEKTSS